MTKSSVEKSRPWTIEDLYNRKEHIRAIPVLVLEKWEKEGKALRADYITTDEIHSELLARGLLEKPMNRQGAGSLVGSLRQKQQIYNLQPILVESADKGEWHFNIRYYENLLREFRERYPIMNEDTSSLAQGKQRVATEKHPSAQFQSLTNSIMPIIQEYEKNWEQRLQDCERQSRSLELEIERLRSELKKYTHPAPDELRIKLAEILKDRLSNEDLHSLCFRLGLEYENLPGDTRGMKAQSLVTHFHYRENLFELQKMLQELRPDIDFT